ncbi:hypothetical protein [Vibrio algarum]|uniref:Uncharacterized protein n=1 Tax=Vibrio algarum TaxID=3020714 RepID=A0ABT4YTG9_9VIBR|nr:hypothetical protein [Vibrio sp. KJ40-1]MDB1124349.1 hypothetical protein [Vibrio sp. KJ40-1]
MTTVPKVNLLDVPALDKATAIDDNEDDYHGADAWIMELTLIS